MIAQHSPAIRTYVTGACADSFIFRTDLPPDALLHLLGLSRAIWQTRKTQVSSAHAHMDTKVRKENAAAITDHFVELLKSCTKPKRSPRDRGAERTRFSCKPSNTSKRRLSFTSPMALPLATRDRPAQASQPTVTTPWSTQQPSRWGRPPTTWRNFMACARRSQTRCPGTTPTAAAHQDTSTFSATTCTPSTSASASGRPKPTDRSSLPSTSSSPTCGDRLSSPSAGSRDTPMSKVMKWPISSPNLVPRPAHRTKSPPLCERPSPTRAVHYQRGFPPVRKARPSPPHLNLSDEATAPTHSREPSPGASTSPAFMPVNDELTLQPNAPTESPSSSTDAVRAPHVSAVSHSRLVMPLFPPSGSGRTTSASP
jgi:hypothetical protein